MTRKLTFNIQSENDCFPILPSDRYIDLTLSTSGSNYAALANGYFYIEITLPLDAYFNMHIFYNNSLLYTTTIHATHDSYNQADIIPILKNYQLVLEYNEVRLTNYFKFIYAQGQRSIIKI